MCCDNKIYLFHFLDARSFAANTIFVMSVKIQ